MKHKKQASQRLFKQFIRNKNVLLFWKKGVDDIHNTLYNQVKDSQEFKGIQEEFSKVNKLYMKNISNIEKNACRNTNITTQIYIKQTAQAEKIRLKEHKNNFLSFCQEHPEYVNPELIKDYQDILEQSTLRFENRVNRIHLGAKSPLVLKTLKAKGLKRAHDINLHSDTHELEQAIFNPAKNVETLPIKRNEHLPLVEGSVLLSVQRLHDRYPGIDPLKSLSEIEAFIENSQIPQDTKENALKTLKHIHQSEFKSQHLKKTLKDFLALVWTASLDQSYFDEMLGASQSPKQDQHLRQLMIIENLAYGGQNWPTKIMFWREYRNKIVGALDRCHPDTKLLHSISILNEFTKERAINFFEDLDNKEEVFEAFNTAQTTKQQESLIKAFFTDSRAYLEAELKEVFHEAIPPEVIKKALNHVDYINIPHESISFGQKQQLEADTPVKPHTR